MNGSPTPGATTDRPKLITRPALAAARRSRVTVIAWLVLLATGIYAFVVALDREGFPPVNVPIAVVSANWFVDDELRVDEELAAPVFEAFKDIEGVEGVSTFSRPDGFAAVFEFETTFSSADGVAALNAATAPTLPEGVTIAIDPVDATKFLENYDLIVTVIGPNDATPEELEAQAEIAAEALRPLSTVTDAEALDLLTESFDPSTNSNEIRRTDFTRYAEQGDTAGTESVLIGITRNLDADADVLDFSDQIQERLDQGIDGLDPAYRAVIGADFASDVRAQLSNLTSNLLFGLLAVAVVSYLLIGWRTALVTAVFMATVMLVTMIGLWAIGYTLNTITFFALVLTLGLLVDDAIVISESIDSSRDGEDGSDEEASLGIVRRALDRVGAASFAGTLSTLTVFAPMAFVTGILGEFIRPIPITVIVTLALSFVLSVTVIPALGRVFILSGNAQGPLVRPQRAVSSGLGSLARFQSGNGPAGWAVGVGVVLGAFVLIVLGLQAAGRVGFNIFPPTKDSNQLQVTADFDAGTSIEDARAIQEELDAIIVDVLGEDLDRYQVIAGTQRSSFAFVELIPFSDRGTTSPTYSDRIEEATAELPGVRVGSIPVSNGPPVSDFPFTTQIAIEPGQEAAALALAQEIASELPGTVLDKTSGDTTTVTAAFVASAGQAWRVDGQLLVEVAAGFDTDDTTANLEATEALLIERYPGVDLEERGLAADALGFDFGLESDNQDDFAALGVALIVALILTLLFLIIQFRAIVQPILIFIAVPFGFFGVFTLLDLSDNPLSFFVMVGFIALIGVAINNTILLVDAANQARQAGASPGDGIAIAVEQRFRPLLVTTVTTVAGLLPLALADPFWEALCFVLIGGLLSSTFLVVTAFPALYLALATVVNWFRRLFGFPNRFESREPVESVLPPPPPAPVG
ncbi:MAG: efflux RND transporter permease subunit [Actinomycetota bacterium]